MNRSPIFRTLLLCLVLVSALTAAQTLFAQDGNLLTNPGFEKPFQTVAGSTSSMVAQGWTAWALQQGQNKEPEYYPASDTTNGMPTPRIHSGSDAQQYFSYFAPHIGGVYQTVSGVNAGDQLSFSIYAYVWSSNGSSADSSDGTGQINFQVGIDPNGGTDSTSSSIVWSTAQTTYDKYAQYSVSASAAGSSVTVFVRSIVSQVTMNNVIYIDDASLTVTGSGTPPVASTASAASTTSPALATAAVLPATEIVVPPTIEATTEVTAAVLPATEVVAPPTVAVTTEASAAATVLPFETTTAPTEAVTEAVTEAASAAPVITEAATQEVTQPPTLQIIPVTVEATEAATIPVIVTEATTPEITAVVPTAVVTTPVVTAPVVPPTIVASPTEVPTNTATNTATFTEIPTNTPTTAPTNTPTTTPTEGPSLTPSNTPTASNTPLPTNTFTPSNTPKPSSTPTPSPTLNQTQFPYLLQYTVVHGDTVSALATRFGSTVSAIIIANQLGSDARIFVTQKLVIPVGVLPQSSTATQAAQSAPTLVPPTLIPSATPTTLVPPTLIPTATETAIVVQPAATTQGQAQTVLIMTTYTVRYGDTLSTIAARFGLTTQQLADANDIVNPNLVRLGQVLKIPQTGTATPMPTSTPVPSSTNAPSILPTATASSTAIPVQPAQPVTYQVMPGDNLYRISVKFNVPIVALIEANGIFDANRIFVGQILIIP